MRKLKTLKIDYGSVCPLVMLSGLSNFLGKFLKWLWQTPSTIWENVFYFQASNKQIQVVGVLGFKKPLGKELGINMINYQHSC